MEYLGELHSNHNSSGNGRTPVNGRGSLRRKLTESQRVALAVDIATAVVPFVPSFKQSAAAVGTTPYRMRQERKARSGDRPAVAQSRKRRVSDRKAWQLRQRFLGGLGRARIAAELAHELGVDLGALADQSGNVRQFSPTFATCLNVLTAQVVADLANFRD